MIKSLVKMGIRLKFTLGIVFAAVSVMIACAGLVYLLVYELRSHTIGERLRNDSAVIAEAVSRIINAEINDMAVHLESMPFREDMLMANSKYTGKSPEEIAAYLSEMDKDWQDPSRNGILLKEYLENPLSRKLKKIADIDKRISGIFIADRYGGLIAASGKTGDFYQADEKWWMDAFDGGRGKIVVEDVEFDESSNVLTLTIAMPVRDDDGSVIGICKELLGVESLFAPLEQFKIGNTGHALLADDRYRILHHRGVKPLSSTIANEWIIKSISADNKGWVVFNELPALHKNTAMVGFSPVHNPLLMEKGIKLTVFISQDMNEILLPLNILVLQLLGVLGIGIIFLIPFGYFIGGIIAKPVEALNRATQEITRGNFDYPINIKTGDEIEQFADSFNDMIFQLKTKEMELIDANEDIMAMSKGLEKKVEKRTRELSEAQSASLNTLADLKAANEKLTLYTKELERSNEELEKAKGEMDIRSWGLSKANESIKALYKEIEEKNEQLKKIDRLKSDFVSVVSHELRTPLAIIKEGVSLVLDGVTGAINPNQKRMLDTAYANIDRLATIINDLLDISKIEAGKMELKRMFVDISEVVRDTAEKWRLESQKKHQEIEIILPNERIALYIDPDRIIQVLNNLISNAIKYTPEKGKVVVELYDKENRVEVSVSDTGIGIAREDIPKIFSKFQQFGRTVGPGQKGTGLGLAIAKELMEMHQGTIKVESEINKGARFTFSLPKVDTETILKAHITGGIKEAAMRQGSLSLMVIRIADLAQMEKELGFEKACNMLKDIEKIIGETFRRRSDIVLRDTGEVTVILLDTPKTNTGAVKNRVEEAIKKYLSESIDEPIKMMRFTINCATYPEEGASGEELLKKARE